MGTGHFNGDIYSDILWQNNNGAVTIWEMNGVTVVARGKLGNPGISWHAIGTGDFNGDNHSDILWQNDSGEVAIWEMKGITVIGSGSLRQSGTELGMPSPLAILMVMVIPTYFGRTTAGSRQHLGDERDNQNWR